MRSLAIIPVRAGSKRVPGKNRESVGGLPLWLRAVESAAACDEVVVSTDDPLVADGLATYIHAEPRRIERLSYHPREAGTDGPLEDVIADIVTKYTNVGAETHGIGVDAFVLLQPTSPFRTVAHVSAALAMLEAGASCVVSVTPLHNLSPAFSGEVFDGVYYPRNTTAARRPSSGLTHLCYENGAIYAFTLAHWKQHRKRLHNEAAALVMHRSEATEIDTPEDLEEARALDLGRRCLAAGWNPP